MSEQNKLMELSGIYVSGWRSATDNWSTEVCPAQEHDFPLIYKMAKGTFNIKLFDPQHYEPSDIPLLRQANGNHSCISKAAKVVLLNGQSIEAWIYDGGWPDDTIELLSATNIAITLNIKFGDKVTILVEEKM